MTSEETKGPEAWLPDPPKRQPGVRGWVVIMTTSGIGDNFSRCIFYDAEMYGLYGETTFPDEFRREGYEIMEEYDISQKEAADIFARRPEDDEVMGNFPYHTHDSPAWRRLGQRLGVPLYVASSGIGDELVPHNAEGAFSFTLLQRAITTADLVERNYGPVLERPAGSLGWVVILPDNVLDTRLCTFYDAELYDQHGEAMLPHPYRCKGYQLMHELGIGRDEEAELFRLPEGVVGSIEGPPGHDWCSHAWEQLATRLGVPIFAGMDDKEFMMHQRPDTPAPYQLKTRKRICPRF